MIENLFSSKIQFYVLKSLFLGDKEFYSTSEIIEKVHKNQANVLRELEKLLNYGFVTKNKQGNKNFYSLDKNNSYYDQLRGIFRIHSATEHLRYQKIWSRRPYPPLVMLTVARATVDGFAKHFPSKINQAFNFWEQEENTYYYPSEQIEKTVDNLINQALKDPKKIMNLFRKTYEKAVDLCNFSDRLRDKDVKKISDKELFKFNINLIDKFCEMYSYGTTQILIGYSDDNLIYKKARAIISKKIKKSTRNFSDYFIDLTAIPKKLETDFQFLDIIKLAQKADKRGLKTKKEILNGFKNELRSLVKKYSYISYDLKNEAAWDKDHYALQILEKINSDFKQEIIKLEKYEQRVENKFRQAVKELGLTKKERTVFDILRQLGYYKWAREYAFLYALFNVKPAQDEMARRKGFDGVDFRFLAPEEISDFVEHPDKFKSILKRRRQYFYAISLSGGKTQNYSGNKAKELINKISFGKLQKVGQGQEIIKGTTASSGKARGKVKIVNIVRHIGKMDDGNILVSLATTPDLLPAMKQSAAIITDEGGVTCHAAIVSRELKIPCIVGTKNATKVLSDGDEVEVDADNGNIKVIKRVK